MVFPTIFASLQLGLKTKAGGGLALPATAGLTLPSATADLPEAGALAQTVEPLLFDQLHDLRLDLLSQLSSEKRRQHTRELCQSRLKYRAGCFASGDHTRTRALRNVINIPKRIAVIYSEVRLNYTGCRSLLFLLNNTVLPTGFSGPFLGGSSVSPLTLAVYAFTLSDSLISIHPGAPGLRGDGR